MVFSGGMLADWIAVLGFRNHVTDAPPDPILAVGVAFNADPVRTGPHSL